MITENLPLDRRKKFLNIVRIPSRLQAHFMGLCQIVL